MDTLLSVLLYIHALPGPGTYHSSYIQQLTMQHQAQIYTIEHNPPQLQSVMQMEQPLVNQVVIINDNAGNN